MVRNYLRTGTPFDYDADDADDWLDAEFDPNGKPSEESGKLFEEED